MKKIFALIMALVLVASLVGCKKSNVTETSSFLTYWVDEDGEVHTSGAEKNNSSGENSKGSKTNKISSKVTSSENFSNKTSHSKTGEKLLVDGIGQDKYADYNASGKVVVAISATHASDYAGMLDVFTEIYPKIQIEIDYRTSMDGDNYETASYLSACAAAGNMPDVIFDDAGILPTYITQGWMEPLDSYVKNDKTFTDGVPKNLVEDYTYGGKLFALPHQAHFNVIAINTDLLDSLNMKLPSLSWTPTDLANMMKKATTDEYSGVEYLDDMSACLPALFSGGLDQNCYNPKTRSFDLQKGYSQYLTFYNDLIKFPALDAYKLRGTGDFYAKFGLSESGDADAAWKAGKILFSVARGTWAAKQYESQCKFNYKLWTYPQVTKGAIPVHIDHCFMTKSAKNKAASFQVLRYMTYSVEGNLARLAMYESKNKGKYDLNERLYYPTTLNSKISEKFNSLPGVTDVDKYMYENIGNGFRQDLIKLVPGFTDIGTKLSTIKNVSQINSVQNTVNKMVTDSWKSVDDAIKKHYK